MFIGYFANRVYTYFLGFLGFFLRFPCFALAMAITVQCCNSNRSSKGAAGGLIVVKLKRFVFSHIDTVSAVGGLIKSNALLIHPR